MYRAYATPFLALVVTLGYYRLKAVESGAPPATGPPGI
jgi:hypothetical protein